jgi:hypothetical protein
MNEFTCQKRLIRYAQRRVGAENLCRLSICPAGGDRLGPAFDVGRAGLGPAGGGMIFGLRA